MFGEEGMSPDPGKVDLIVNISPPSSVSECRSFLGMTNYVADLYQVKQTLLCRFENEPKIMLNLNGLNYSRGHLTMLKKYYHARK